MKSMLTAFAALAALALPAGLPTLAMAQDELQMEAESQNDVRSRAPRDEARSEARQDRRQERGGQPAEDRRGAGRVDRGGTADGEGRRPRGGGGGMQGRDDPGNGGPGGGWTREPDGQTEGGGRGDRPRGDRERGDRDRGEGRGGWTRPESPTAPVIVPPVQDRGGPGRDRDRDANGQDWNRGNDGRDREGGRNGGRQDYATSQGGPQRVAPRGSFADSCGGSYVNQGRLYADCRDTRGNVRGTSIELGRCASSDIGNDNGRLVCHNVRGDFESRRGNNGDRDRDLNNGGRNWNDDRQGRRDYGDFRNRWNQNDWRRDWSRSRSQNWWRNDRGFRGYTGFRSGFYFAPNYGYYAVPRSYLGQRWSIGSYLPSIFWRYSLNDYRTYGLGYPPPGTRWVAVDTTIYLIDSRDGYIIEVIYDAWRW